MNVQPAVPLATLQIGLIASTTQTSGSDRYYFSLLRALSPLGVRFSGIVLGDPAAVDQPVAGVESFAPEGTGTLGRWRGLRRVFRRQRGATSLIVSHFAPHVFPVLDLLEKRKLVVHFHGPWALEGRHAGLSRKTFFVRMLQEKMVYARAARIIVLSRAFGDILVNDYGVPREKIRIIPGGVDLARFHGVGSRADARRTLGWPVDRPIVATVRRLAPTKGIENLIDAVTELRRRIPNVLVVIAGTGGLAEQFQAQVRRADLGDAVRFAGLVPDALLPFVYRAADLFVVPTVAFEGFGLVVLESLACGTPALVTPVSGLPEVVTDTRSPLIVRRSGGGGVAAVLPMRSKGNSPCPARRRASRMPSVLLAAIAERARAVYAEALTS